LVGDKRGKRGQGMRKIIREDEARGDGRIFEAIEQVGKTRLGEDKVIVHGREITE